MARFLSTQKHYDAYMNGAAPWEPRQLGRSQARNLDSTPLGSMIDSTVVLRQLDHESARKYGTSPLKTFEPQLRSLRHVVEEKHAQDSLRIIFCASERPEKYTSEKLDDIMYLLNHFDVPSTFLMEKFRSVTHAFGTQEGSTDDSLDLWYRFLGKDLKTFDMAQEASTSGSDHTWITASFYIRWNPTERNATMLCFNADPVLYERLQEFSSTERNVEAALAHPFALLLPLLNHYFEVLDETVWKLLDTFEGGIERNLFDIASRSRQKTSTDNSIAPAVDFALLHNVAKHVLHLLESVEASLEAVGMILKQQQGFSSTKVAAETSRGLHYQEGLFTSLRLRLKSMETRVNNVIGLAFHLVADQDSIVLQMDSAMMKTIAIVTLVFLPPSAVASIFGVQFLNYDPDRTKTSWGGLSISPMWWIFLAIAIPVTLITMGLWLWWRRMEIHKVRKRRRSNMTATADGSAAKWKTV